MDKAVTLQTAILKSDRDKLQKIQKGAGHASIGETIGWLVKEFEARKDIRGG